MRVLHGLCLLALLAGAVSVRSMPGPQSPPLRFEITTNSPPASGRLFVIIANSDRPEPRLTIGETGMAAPPTLGRDLKNFGAGAIATVDKNAPIFPIATLDALPAGDYSVQALFDTNIDVASVNAPGNQYSDV